MFPTKSFAALDPKKPLQAFTIQRREPGINDVQIKIMYCGICHTDIQPTNQPTNQPSSQAANQTNQPTNQPTNQTDQTDQTD